MRYLFLLLFFPLLVRGQTVTNLVLYSTDTELGSQAGWTWWYSDSVCPSGMARQLAAAPSISATGVLNFPVTLVPGSYSAYVKVISYNNTVGVSTLAVGLQAPGGTLLEANADDRNSDAYWTSLGSLVIPTATTNLTFSWRTLDGATLYVKSASMVSVYLTTDTGFILTSDDYIQKWVVPTATDTNAPIAGNLLPNSSFEWGLDGWSLFPNTKVFYSAADIVITNDSMYGVQSIGIPNLPVTTSLASSILELTSMPMLVRPNKAHTLSWWVRVSGGLGKVQARIKPALEVPTGFGLAAQTNYASPVYSVTSTNWLRYSLNNMILRDYPSPAQYYVEFDFDPTGVAADTKIYLDAIQFEEGDLPTVYAPAYVHEVGIEQTQQGGTYYVEDNNSVVNLVVSGTGVANLTLTYQISNRTFTNVLTYTNSTQFNPGRYILPINCNNIPLGAFRIAAWLSNGSETEAYFSRIHRPQSLPRGEGIFGNHMEQWWGNTQIAKKRGYTFSRVFSPTGRFRWQFIEPSQDTFSFGDATMDLVLQEIEPFCNLYQTRAVWADRHYLKLTNVVGSFQLSEPVSTPALAGGTITWIGTPAQNITGDALQLTSVTGTLLAGHVLTGSSSAATATITFVSEDIYEGGVPRQTPSIPDYTNYVANMVAHYTNKFFAYEVMNEPDRDKTIPKPPGWTYNFYAEVLHQSMKAIKAVYPAANVVGFSGISQTNDWGILWNLCPPYVRTNLYATSVHLYERDSFRNEQFVNLSAANNGPPIWMTEGGCFNFSQYYGCRAAWRNFGYPLNAFRDSEDFMRTWNEALEIGPWNQIEAIGGGVRRHFYYGYQYYHHYGDPQAYSVQYTGLDMQEAAKPIDVAQSFVLYSLDGGKGYGKPQRTDTGVKSYLFDGPWNTPYLAIKDINTVTVNINTALPTRTNRIMFWDLTNDVNVKAYTILGNAVQPYIYGSGDMDPQTLPFGTIPILIKGINGTTLNQISNAYMTASFSTARPDTNAPVISICEYPKGPVGNLRKHRIRFRWLVYDEFYTTRTYFNAVDTRFKMDSATFSPWGQDSFIEYPSPATGFHTFTVEARDNSGNLATNVVAFSIQ